MLFGTENLKAMEEKMSNKAVELTQKLIRRESYSGNEKGVSEELQNYFKENGFDDAHVDKYGNTIGVIKGSKPGPKILFDGHMDTVPVTEESEWEYPPFAAEVHDGKLYGRGASDMKGALASMAVAASNFKEKTGGDFAGEIYVGGIVHEECFEGVAAREVSAYAKPDYVIIGEASQCNIKIGQRGRAEIKIEVTGKPAHSANPEKGINAVYKMCKVIEAIQGLELTHHDRLGYGILELVDIKSSPFPGASVVPEKCIATYDRRLLVDETKESVLEPINKLLADLMKEDDELKVKAYYTEASEDCYTGNKIEGERFFPGWIFDEDEEWVQRVVEKVKEKGQNPEITQYNFCTNGSHYAGEAKIKTLGLGPSLENLAHTVNEYIEVAELDKVVEAYEAVMEALLV